MENLQPVFWHQGLFLQPQHFQLSELYQQSLIRPLQQHLHPHFWGVIKLNLLDSALEQRRCEITSAECLFPDGSYIRLNENAIINERSFEDDWVESDKPFTIYLGLKKLSAYEDNVAIVDHYEQLDKLNTRYVCKPDPTDIKDIYQQGAPAQSKLLNYVIQVIWETELDKYSDRMLMPIAKVVRAENGINVESEFCPPMLNIGVNEHLHRLIKDIRDDITGRITQLESYDRHKKNSSNFDATLLRYKLATRTLSRYIPKLFHITEDQQIHPWQVYGLMRELIAEVSTFTETVNVLGENNERLRLLPKYNHLDIGDCFVKAKSLLTTLLNEITVGPQFIVDMPLVNNVYKADIPQEFFEQSVDFYLIISSQDNFQQQQHSLLTTAKLAAVDMVEVLAERSLPGVGLIHIPHPPADMPRRPDANYVRLDTHDEQWTVIERHKDIALLWDEAPEDVKIELVIVRR